MEKEERFSVIEIGERKGDAAPVGVVVLVWEKDLIDDVRECLEAVRRKCVGSLPVDIQQAVIAAVGARNVDALLENFRIFNDLGEWQNLSHLSEEAARDIIDDPVCSLWNADIVAPIPELRSGRLFEMGMARSILSIKQPGRSLILTHFDNWRTLQRIDAEIHCTTLLRNESDYAKRPASPGCDVLLASVRPLSARLWPWPCDYFSRIIIDARLPGESLRCYRKIAEHFLPAEIIGGADVQYRNPLLTL